MCISDFQKSEKLSFFRNVKFSFKAKIYKAGINPCVKVPGRITNRMEPVKGYVAVKGTMDNFPFMQTLVPVRNESYHLHVNRIMLKGTGLSVGSSATFIIEQIPAEEKDPVQMPAALKKKLQDTKLMVAFNQLTPYRQKEILKYLNYLKTEEALNRNIEKVIVQLRGKNK